MRPCGLCTKNCAGTRISADSIVEKMRRDAANATYEIDR
jgi:hypothetical protein